MSATTWTKFFWSDWESDESLKMCSPGAQGLWMRMLCVCAKTDGYLLIAGKRLDADDMATLTGWPVDDVRRWWDELKRWEVFSVEGRGKVYCRRMVKAARKADIARENGQNGGNPNLRKVSGNQPSDNQNPTDTLTDLPGKPSAICHNEEAIASSPGKPVAKAKDRRKPETPIPEGFPDQEAKDDARSRAQVEGREINPVLEAERFRNHALANDRRLRDWRGGWRNWIITALERAPAKIVSALPLIDQPKFSNLRVRQVVVAAQDEAWAVSWLDRCKWREADKAILCPQKLVADTLRRGVPELESRGAKIIFEPPSEGGSVHPFPATAGRSAA
jgi:hypothetical protein